MNDLVISVGDDFKTQDLFQNVQLLVQECADTSDFDSLVDNMIGLRHVHERSGVALAWLWYKTKQVWHKFGLGDNFEDTVAARTGYNLEVIRRYVRVAEMLDSAPAEVVEQLSSKGIKALIPAANAYAGHDFTETDWQSIAESDPDQISSYVRDAIRQEEPRSNYMRIWMDRTGSLWVYTGNNERQFIGSLEVGIAKEEPNVEKAIARIIQSAGIKVD